MTTILSEKLDCGCVFLQDQQTLLKDVSWNDHPSFEGVRIKHLIQSKDTEKRFSSHLVRVAPGCVLDTHAHETQTEMHLVLEGGGECELCGRGVAYEPGRMAVIPQGSAHRVRAGEQGLTLLAQFTPPLL